MKLKMENMHLLNTWYPHLKATLYNDDDDDDDDYDDEL